jgi:tetratricopeptide (TPR) repeat protein
VSAKKERGGASEGDTSTSPVVWGVAGMLMVALILAVALPAVQSAREASGTPAAPAGAGPAGGTGAVDLASMTPRQAADQLYDRIMRTSSAGDSAGAAFFLPMAMQAYDRARPLDADGLFHLSLLQRMAGDPEAGLATAREGLAVQPNHLLVLATAAGAAAEMGDTAAAQEYYDQLLASWDEEMGKGLPEYEAHAGMMPEIRQDAESFSGG